MAILSDLRRRDVRTLAFLTSLPLVALGFAACSLALDTNSLQSGSTAGAGGNGGAGGSAGTVDTDAGNGDTGASGGDADASSTNDASADSNVETGAPCSSDLECEDGNACTVDTCGSDHHCTGAPWTGLGVEPVGAVELALAADEIGLPVLAGDKDHIILAAWYRNGTTADVELRKYYDDPAVGAVHGPASSFISWLVKSYLSSPGLLLEDTVPRTLRVVGAIVAVLNTDSQISFVDFDISGANLALTKTQPSGNSFASPGYDADPHQTAPRIWNAGSQEAIAWVQNQKLMIVDGSAATVGYAGDTIADFAPLPSSLGGTHALLETADGPSATTEVWTKGGPISSLPGDPAGEPRRGISIASLGNNALDLVLWSTGRDMATVKSAGVICAPDSCATIATPAVRAMDSTGFWPVASSAPLAGDANSGDIGVAVQIRGAGVNQTATTSALVASLSRIQVGAMNMVTATPVNPPSFLVRSVEGGGTDAMGRHAVVVTPTEQMMIAWVEATPDGKYALKTRRYRTKTCP